MTVCAALAGSILLPVFAGCLPACRCWAAADLRGWTDLLRLVCRFLMAPACGADRLILTHSHPKVSVCGADRLALAPVHPTAPACGADRLIWTRRTAATDRLTLAPAVRHSLTFS